MLPQVLVPRPNLDTRSVEQLRPPDAEAAVKENLYAGVSAGQVTAGYRSAKYTPEEWFTNNHATLNQAATHRDNAQRVQRASKALYTQTDNATLRTQAEGTKHLGERLQDIYFWKSELERHIERLLAETDLLLAQKRRLEKALDATEIPFAIATDNLTCRERRFGPDLVQDQVEEELLKEVELIRSIQALLKKTLDQVVNQIRLNREAKQTLEHDWSDKHQAYNLDDQCGRYSNRSRDTQHYSSSAKVHDQLCDSSAWVGFTQTNLALAEREEMASGALRALCERVLQETAEDLRAQCAMVEEAFSRRTQDLNQARNQLELQLTQVLEEIGAQERNICSLQQAVYDKEAPLRVAQSRLYCRAQRPNMEHCRDQPQISLLDEVEQISGSVQALQGQLAEARASLAQLEDSRLLLQKDIGCKTHSLLIDREKCMRHRTHYPNVLTLSGY
ncbi:tektin-4 [Brachyhypopomus gauderio]|uniref:tektin-4 n=1 Tax=Brachyhypopomus gauderio TaxID=698409 RepID=UPI0040434BA3